MIANVLATWKEIYRKKVFLVSLLLTLGLLVLVTLVTWFVERALQTSVNADNVLDQYLNGSAMFTIALFGANFSVAYLSIFTAAGTIAGEIDSGLLLAILPRPLPRWRVYCGKWLGYTLWSAAYAGVLFWCLAIIIHVNMHFAMLWPALLGSFWLFLLIPVILVTLTMLGSTYLSAMANGIFVILLFGIGLFGDLLGRAGFGAALATAVQKVGLVTSLVMPTDAVYERVTYNLVGAVGPSIFGTAAQFVGRGILPMVPSARFIGYAVAYAIIMLVWGMVRFSRRDV